MKFVQLRKVTARTVADVNVLLHQLKEHPRRLTAAGLKRIVASSGVELWATQDGKRITGMALLLFLSIPTADYVRVEDVVVDEVYRGKGLGKRLMRHLIARARKRKAQFVGLNSNPSRVAANRLYKKLGFKLRKTNAYRLQL